MQGETNAEIHGLALDQRGCIVRGGDTTVEEGGSFEVELAVVRFLLDGMLDPLFNLVLLARHANHRGRPGMERGV